MRRPPILTPAWAALRGPGALPREARDTLFLLGVIAVATLPLAPRLPGWTLGLVLGVLLWRGLLALAGAPLPGRWTLLTVLAAAVGLTYWTHQSLLGRSPGLTLLVMLVALKTLELRARRDAFVVFFLGFFLVLTQFLGSQSPLTAVLAGLAVWGLLSALVLAHLPVGRPPLRQAAGLAGRCALLGTPLMLLLFVLFPRVGPLWSLPADAAARSGLSNEMTLGDVAELALDDRIALRLRLPPGQRIDPGALYFRGPVLSQFDGWRWRPLRPSFPAALQAPLNLRTDGPGLDYELTLEPLRIASLPLLEATPGLDTGADAPRLPPGLQARLGSDLHWRLNAPLTERVQLRATAWLRHAHGPVDPVLGLQDELSLPPGHNPRLLALAAELRRRPELAQADARRLSRELLQTIRQQPFRYTLSPGAYGEDGPEGALDEFWFDRRAGFCEHYAAAFVVLMRALDVPARIVTGYQGAEFNPVDGSYIVRQRHAHAWAEVWQPGEGWLRVDPTAAVAPDRVERSAALQAAPGFVAGVVDGFSPDLRAELRARWDALNARWDRWVLQYGRGQQLDLLRRLGLPQPDAASLGRILGGSLAALALLGVAWAALAGLRARRREPWGPGWERICAAARAAGVPARPSWTPRRLAAALEARHGPAARTVGQHLAALEAERYRPGPAGGHAQALLRRQLRATRTALRALPAPSTPAPPAEVATGLARPGASRWTGARDARTDPSCP